MERLILIEFHCIKLLISFIEILGSCVYHPGEPFFHDAYKGWSCCKKKCTDFTEFLNIKVINI